MGSRLFHGSRNLLAAGAVLYCLVSFTPLITWWARALAGPWKDPKGDILIVLSGSELDRYVLGESSYWRSVYALRAYQEGGFRQLVLSGGGEQRPIAELMQDFLVCHGVAPGIVEVEPRSRSTRENALFTAQLLRGVPGRKVLLTSDYHMFRARRVFEKAGMEVSPRPIPDAIKRSGDWRGRWPVFLELTEETAKQAYYKLRGWM